MQRMPRKPQFTIYKIDLSRYKHGSIKTVGDFVHAWLENANISIDDVKVWFDEVVGEALTLRNLPAVTRISRGIHFKVPETATGKLVVLVGRDYSTIGVQRTLVTIEQDDVGLAKETTLSGIKAQTDKLSFDSNNFLKATIANSEIAVPVDVQYNSLDVPYSALWNADETAAQSIVLDTQSFKLLEVYAKASTATNIHLDVSPDNTNWITDYKVYSNVTEVKDTLWNGFRHVKLRSDAAGSSGDTITLVLSAKP